MERYWNSKAFMEKSVMDSWSGYFLNCSYAVLVIMEKMGISFENSKTETVQNDKSIYSFCIAVIEQQLYHQFMKRFYIEVFLYIFRNRYGIWGGMFISSIIFTVVHIPTYNTLPVNF